MMIRWSICHDWYQVVPGTRRGGSFEKETWLIGIHGELERRELKWHEMHEVHELTWIMSHEWLGKKELKRINWNKWMIMNDLKWMNWKKGIEMKELKWINWNEWLDMNELRWMNWKEWIAKSGPKLSVSYVFYVKSSSRCSLAHILLPTFRIEARSRGNRDPPAATTDSHFTQKCFQPWIHAFRIAHTSQLLDDVIDMMMWLTWWLRWWCGCHDGETASHWQSSVTRKFPN